VIDIGRYNRIDAPLGEYHVVIKGNGGQFIFEDDSDRIAFLRALIYYKEKYEFRLHAYALMGNHVHLLLYTDGMTLSKVMQGLQLKYVFRYKKKYELEGHLFKGRFYSTPVYDNRGKIAELRYIHNNPVKAGLGRIDKYKWSSYNEYIHGKMLCDTEDLTPLFDGVEGYKTVMGKPDDSEQFEGPSRKYISDQKARLIIAEMTGDCDFTHIASLPLEQRNILIKRIQNETMISVLQLSRLTGISRGVIKRIIS